MPPPRSKPCPACAAPCPVAATRCGACGRGMPRVGGGRPAPTPEQRLAVAMTRQAVADGHMRGPMPEPLGRRNLSKKGAKVLAEIRRLAADKKNATEIAAAIGCSVTNVRRYAHDYGVRIVKGESGPAMNGKLYVQTVERVEACRLIMQRTTVVAEVAEALGVCKATAREYMKRVRDVSEIELPGFDQRKASGFAVTRRRKPAK
ncbi:helix-turn-helix DNA binding domain protein [Rhodobacter phage RcHartney]|nr:helix-turn-helix DNA binding domain protein [Rhodobacter phage RcHartney]